MSTDQPEDEQTRPDWVSYRAVAWVIDDAPVPADLAWTLTVIARRCNKHGKGSRQTTKTIAAKAGKSVKQAQREIVRLRELGLIVLGDQSLVDHIPAGQRPTVYDVPLHLKGPKPQKESRNKSGLRKDAQPADTPPMEGTPPLEGGPRMEGGSTPPIEGEPTPPLEGSQKKTLKKPLKNPSLSGDLPSVPAPRDPEPEDGERDGSTSSSTANLTVQQRLVIKHGCPEHLAQLVVEYIEATNTIDGLGWWITADRNGTLAVQVQAGIAANTPTTASADLKEVTDCPLHPGFLLTNCPVCWADVKGGDDPYKGREDERPSGWWDLYNQQRRSSQRGQVAPSIRAPFGSHTAGWQRLREERGSSGARKFLRAHEIAAELDAELGVHPFGSTDFDPTRIANHDPEVTR